MNGETVEILVVEDNPVDVLRLHDALRDKWATKFAVSVVESLSEAKQMLGDRELRIILLDLGLPDSQGLDTFLEVRNFAPDIPIVVMSGLDDEALAIEAVANGAQDYLCKDRWDSHLIVRSLNYAMERHQILNALRESEERFRAIFMRAADYIFVRNRAGRYVQVNPAFESLVGRPSGEIIGRTTSDLFGREFGRFALEMDRKVLQGESVEAERTVRISGVPVTLSYSLSPLRNSRGEVVGIFGINRDVTDRKRIQLSGQDARTPTYASSVMRRTLAQAMMVAQKGSTILLLGESGSGKDWLARHIHDRSERAEGPYLALNCAAIAPELAESELFGHEKGAFTDAVGRKRGVLELAEGGTLLLNEIGELSLPLQAKLLTFLDTKKLTRVGGEKEISVDVRLIAATNRDLEKEVEEGRFRQDLFYRLNVIGITVPPLRERHEDIPALAQAIIAQLVTEMQLTSVPLLDARTMDALTRYSWPGNVRELKNVLERALILWDGGRLEAMLPASFGKANEQECMMQINFRGRTLRDVTDEVTRSMCLDALERCQGNKKGAARLLGIARDSLYRYLKAFGIAAESGG